MSLERQFEVAPDGEAREIQKEVKKGKKSARFIAGEKGVEETSSEEIIKEIDRKLKEAKE